MIRRNENSPRFLWDKVRHNKFELMGPRRRKEGESVWENTSKVIMQPNIFITWERKATQYRKHGGPFYRINTKRSTRDTYK